MMNILKPRLVIRSAAN